MQAFVYKGVMGNACGDDKWEDLFFNFDQAVIYNSEQVSGLLRLTPTPFNNPILELSYPIINTNNIDFVNNSKDLEEVIQCIREPISGTKFFNPTTEL